MNSMHPLSLLGKTFEITTVSNIGNIIEVLLGGSINCKHDADLGNWEIKSRNITAKAWVTLGSKKTNSAMEVLDQVYNKIKNVILFEYVLSDDKKYFTVIRITIMYELERESLISSFGVTVKPEMRENHTIMTLKVKSENFVKLYGRKVITYKVDNEGLK